MNASRAPAKRPTASPSTMTFPRPSIKRLIGELNENRLDGIIWIDNDSLKQGRALYERRTGRIHLATAGAQFGYRRLQSDADGAERPDPRSNHRDARAAPI